MRQRWKIVLVDEFQDTDPVQWKVLDRAFSEHATMVLIGDPKQAIYAFRGGDIFTYLEAADTAATRQTLATNWRSDAPLVDALQGLLGERRSAIPGSACTRWRHATRAAVSGGPLSRIRCVSGCSPAPPSTRATRGRCRSTRSGRTSPRTWPTTWRACSPPEPRSTVDRSRRATWQC